MFHFDGYLRFLISAKNVPLWRLFEVSDQYEECSTVTVIWGFWSVRKMFHATVTVIWGFWSVRRMFYCNGYLRFLISTKNISVFLISTKNVSLWRLFEVSDQYEECFTVRLFEASGQCEECSTLTVIWDLLSIRRMFYCNDYLRFLISTKNSTVFLISTKNVPLWLLFEVSDQYEECVTVTVIWGFWSVRRISQCLSSELEYLSVSHQYEEYLSVSH
jgi:hypothetical protein